MKNTISPCCIRWKPNVRVHWKTRADESAKWKSHIGIYWGKLPTEELKKLVEMSKRPPTSRSQLYKKHFLRSVGRTDDGFRHAIISEIKKLKSKFEKELEYKRRSLEPKHRQAKQTSHELTPSVQSWKHFTKTRLKFESMLKTAPKWDDETRAAVVKILQKASKFFAESAGKLSG